MRIELSRETERFGLLAFHGVQKVFELDAGLLHESTGPMENPIIQRISYEALHNTEEQMAIIVPVYDERIRLIEGVLCGIPHHCLTIVVSNSPRAPIDRFHIEKDAIVQQNKFIQKDVVVVHQKDPVLAQAFAEAGYPELLGEDGLIKDGKAEGMILGTLLAKMSGRKYIGFIDSDNYFPGAVHEYVREYSAGFLQSESNLTMVRISWHSKPKIVESGLFFAKRGRASVHTNRALNSFISHYIGFGTEVIKTGNAGEHAMTMDLAMLMGYSAGYSIEPYHFIYLLERFGGIAEELASDVVSPRVEIYQIESRNPHLHESKGETHVEDMSYEAMQVIYHSPLCPPALKEELRQDMLSRNFITEGKEPGWPTYYPSLSKIDLHAFLKTIRNEKYTRLLNPSLTLTDAPQPNAVMPAAPGEVVAVKEDVVPVTGQNGGTNGKRK